MNPERLLQNFDRLIDTPDAVPRLRRFILDLAVRGKLVEQNPEDEPASMVDSIDVPFHLPPTWKWKSVGELGKTQTGSTPPTGERFHYDGNIPFIKPAAIKDGVINYEGQGLTDSGAKESTIVQAEAILMVCIGGTIGKVALADRLVCFNQQINSISPNDANDVRYILLAMQSPYFQACVIDTAAIGTLPIISKGKWERLLIPLPPLTEQHRIVAKVDELMKLCDELESAQAKRERRRDRLVAATLYGLNGIKVSFPLDGNLSEERLRTSRSDISFEDSARFYFNHLPRLTTRPAHIQQLRQSILNLAVRGKLVPQDPKDEPSNELLKRIATEKNRLVATGKIRKNELTTDVKVADEFYESPPKWCWVKWDAVAMKIGDIDHKMPETTTPGIPYVSPRDFLPDNKINFEGAKTISKADFIRLSAKIKPEPGDIIYPRYGTIGENRLVKDQREFLASYSCAVIKVLQGFISPIYQYYFSISDFARDQAKTAENKATQPNVGIKSIKDFHFPLPPLAEQHRIVDKVDELMKLCDELETRITSNSTTSRKFLEATLQEAL